MAATLRNSTLWEIARQMTDSRLPLFDKLGKWFGLQEEVQEEEGASVTWLLLPPYDIPGMAVVSGLLVENQGMKDAEDVFVSLTYEGERFITHMEVVCDEPFEREGGGPRDSYVTIKLRRLPAGGKVVVYVAGHNVQVPEVVVAVQAR